MMLKMRACHGSARDVWRYLLLAKEGGGPRQGVVAAWCREGAPDPDWYRRVDATCWDGLARERRTAAAFHGLAAGRQPRTYYHFILSPAPGDFDAWGRDEGLARLRAAVTDWVAATVGEGREIGVVVHDDGGAGGLHAHLVVAATDDRGNKLQVNMRSGLARMREEADRAGARHGFSSFREHADGARYQARRLAAENERRRGAGERCVFPRRRPAGYERSAAEASVGQAELHMGRGSWMAELRRTVDGAAVDASSFSEFRAILAVEGVVARLNARGNIVYSLRWEDGRIREAKDASLGAAYQADLLQAKFMDLRGCRAELRARRGDLTGAKRDLMTGVSDARAREAERVEADSRAWGAQALRRVEAGLREQARRAQDALAGLDRRQRDLRADLADARLVESEAPEVEPTRRDGRLDWGVVGEGRARAYEAARKRMGRRGWSCAAEVSDALEELEGRRRALEGELRPVQRRIAEVGRAVATCEAIEAAASARAARERAAYGPRIARGRDHGRRPMTRRPPRGTVAAGAARAASSTPLPSAPPVATVGFVALLRLRTRPLEEATRAAGAPLTAGRRHETLLESLRLAGRDATPDGSRITSAVGPRETLLESLRLAGRDGAPQAAGARAPARATAGAAPGPGPAPRRRPGEEREER